MQEEMLFLERERYIYTYNIIYKCIQNKKYETIYF